MNTEIPFWGSDSYSGTDGSPEDPGFSGAAGAFGSWPQQPAAGAGRVTQPESAQGLGVC